MREVKLSDGLFDIHCHILYDVDDGAKNIKEAIQMIDMAYKDGTRNIMLTPHYQRGVYNMSVEQIRARFEHFQEQVNKRYPDLSLFLGMEIFYHVDILSRLEENVITLSDTSYVLVEFLPQDDLKRIIQGTRELQKAGLWPILAHAERYYCLEGNYDAIEELIESGIYIQINASSIVGKRGWKIKRFTKKLLDYEMVHFIGSDAHGTQHRRPLLSDCAKYIAKKWDSAYVKELMMDNPSKVVWNQRLRLAR